MGSLFSQRQGEENPEHDDIEDHVIEAAQPHSPASPQQTRISLAFFNAPNRLSSLANAHPEIIDLVSESLISRGALRSLASLNSASRSLYAATLPLLWRTFIWDPYGKGRKKTKAYWDLLSTCRGAEYIRFFVDRAKKPSSSHKKLPGLVSQLIATTGDQLKAYIAEFNDDGETKFVDSDERKVICHLLPAYEPMSAGDEDLITLRHALVHLAPPSGRPDSKRPSKKKPVIANGNHPVILLLSDTRSSSSTLVVPTNNTDHCHPQLTTTPNPILSQSYL
ncbi:hypothetical protein QFC22_004203 [Naganishia vaughanmartiniae]|uniref:Uncharacterized protein n=1 Tax=Naganishia vaughanmartiniae TaxID=1424756 RepID=A0ACC2X6B0_9TREE|nr:hypothetical protein QFC22_004203 [Naganishia vaughanmartiniae]